MEDNALIQMLFDRAEAVFEALARRFGRRLTQTARNILNSDEDAEECVNDTYLAIWNAIPPARPDPLAPYVYRTGRNIALNRLRSDSTQKRDSRYDLSLDELAGCIPGASLEHVMDGRILGQSINKFLATLPKTSRIIFLRRYYFGDSVKKIAGSLSLSENTVSVRLNRIREKLRNFLEKEELL
jgi:RNA polymerase sigma-70 factor (ECF subfamily)